MEDAEVNEESMLVCIAILLGGNPNAQEEFLSYMQQDDQNAFLLKVKEMLVRTFEHVKKVVGDKNLKL